MERRRFLAILTKLVTSASLQYDRYSAALSSTTEVTLVPCHFWRFR